MVVLGLLAAIAISKTTSLVEESHHATAQGAIAVGQSTLTQALAKVMLNPDLEDTAANVTIEANKNKPSGEYTLGFSASSTGSEITITATRDGISTTGTWTMP